MTNTPSDPSALQSAKAAGRQLVAKRREDLRKAALKANMARRKAQVRGREQAADPTGPLSAGHNAETTGIDPDTDTKYA